MVWSHRNTYDSVIPEQRQEQQLADSDTVFPAFRGFRNIRHSVRTYQKAAISGRTASSAYNRRRRLYRHTSDTQQRGRKARVHTEAPCSAVSADICSDRHRYHSGLAEGKIPHKESVYRAYNRKMRRCIHEFDYRKRTHHI